MITGWKSESRKLLWGMVVFVACFAMPVDWPRFSTAVFEALALTKWYAQEHVLLCLIPAFFIAGAIAVFVSQASVMKYLGPKAPKVLAYGVASISGTILAVCSCTVLPLFAGIWRMGAGLGPATAFLYSGPAINVLAIILTARILGLEIGIARAVGAILFSIVIGLIMHLIYRKEETAKADAAMAMPEPQVSRPLWQNAVFFAAMIGVLVFANWGAPNDWLFKTVDGHTFHASIIKASEASPVAYTLKVIDGPAAGREIRLSGDQGAEKTPIAGTWTRIWGAKWSITAGFAAALALILVVWFRVAWWKVLAAAAPVVVLAMVLPVQGLWIMIPFTAAVVGLSAITSMSKGEAGDWFYATWSFAKQILPLLFFGVLVAGFLLGRPDHEGFIPSKYVEMLVGDKPDTFFAVTGWGGGSFESVVRPAWPVWTNSFASIFGAFMYFATLTEVPILQGLMGSGMGKGPALAMLLAGPAVSLPSMLVIRSIMGTQKTVVFVSLVVVMATISGMIFGAMP